MWDEARQVIVRNFITEAWLITVPEKVTNVLWHMCVTLLLAKSFSRVWNLSYQDPTLYLALRLFLHLHERFASLYFNISEGQVMQREQLRLSRLFHRWRTRQLCFFHSDFATLIVSWNGWYVMDTAWTLKGSPCRVVHGFRADNLQNSEMLKKFSTSPKSSYFEPFNPSKCVCM